MKTKIPSAYLQTVKSNFTSEECSARSSRLYLALRSRSYLLPLCLTVGELGKRSEKAVPERTLTELPDPYSWVNRHFPIYYKSCAVKSLRLSVFKVVSCFAVGKPVLQ